MATADKSMYYIVSKNSFAYNPARINVGSIGYYDKPENVIVSSLYEVFKTSEDIDDRFLWHWFKSDAFQRMIEQYQEGGVRLYFYYDKLCMCSLPVPDIQEQRKIGKQLDILDNLITLHQREFVFLCKEKIEIIRYIKNTWEQRKFDEVFDCTIPNNTLSRAELNYESGSVRNIHYGDILIKYGSVVDVQNDEIPFATGKSSDDFKGALLRDGDIIIADTAEDETTGKACEIGNSQGLDVVSGLHTMVCRPRNKMALGYLGYYLNSDAYHHQLLPLMQGIKVLSLSRTNVQKTMVCYPKSKAEQQLIADCFRNLDNLITLHQRKYDKLTNVKKSMLGKMFPQNGSNVPEIRFKGFTEAWEQRKVTEIGKIYIGLVTTMTKHYTDEGTLLIRNSDIKDGKFEFGDNPIYLEKTFAEKNETRMHQIGDVITVHTGDVGTSAVITENEAKSIGFATIVTRPNPKIIDSNYLCSFLNTDKHKKWAVSISTGDGRTNYNLGDYFELVVPVPSIAEQKRIASYIQKLNRLITLHQRKPNFYTGGYYAE